MAGSHRRDKHDPASELYDRWLSHRHDEAAPTSTPEPVPEAVGAVSDVPEAAPTRSEPPHPGPSTNVEFTPRTGAHRLVGVLLLGAVAGLAVAASFAYREQNTLTVGLTATLFVLSMTLWAIRASTAVAHLSVRAGQLVVMRGGNRFVFELSGTGYTPIEVVGTPGDRSWKVLFLRRNMDPFVVDSSMVDPREFMDVLRHYRP